MAEETIEKTETVPETTDNQGNLEGSSEGTPQQTPAETQVDTTQQTISKTEETKPEFSDPNMQTRFTERMTEFADKEKDYEGKVQKLEETQRAFRALTKHPDFNEFYNTKFKASREPAKAQVPELTPDQLEAMQSDPNAMKNYIQQSIDVGVKNVTTPMKEQLSQTNEKLDTVQFTNDINAFADQKENVNFWKYDDYGLMDNLIVKHRRTDPNASNIEVIERAYKDSHKLVENIRKEEGEEAKAKANNLVKDKKESVSDKGNISDSNLTSTKKRTFREALEANARKMNIDLHRI